MFWLGPCPDLAMLVGPGSEGLGWPWYGLTLLALWRPKTPNRHHHTTGDAHFLPGLMVLLDLDPGWPVQALAGLGWLMLVQDEPARASSLLSWLVLTLPGAVCS